MVLQVAFSDFADAARRVLGGIREAYVERCHGKTLVTAGAPGGAIVASLSDLSLEETRRGLEATGFDVFSGRWVEALQLEPDVNVLPDEFFIAGVAYKTEAGPPGIWIDASHAQPTQVQVLRSMYEELIQTGEMANVSFEEFVRLSDANVVVVSPAELRSFLKADAAE